jgi:hypothetical protein
MRFVQTLALVALLGSAAPAPAARGVASASVIVPVVVAVAPASGSLVVSVASVDDGVHEHVTVAFN